jgi:hypothetical protein
MEGVVEAGVVLAGEKKEHAPCVLPCKEDYNEVVRGGDELRWRMGWTGPKEGRRCPIQNIQ